MSKILRRWKQGLTVACLVLFLVIPARSADETSTRLVVAGATATEGLVLSTNATDFTRTIEIINTTNAPIKFAVELSDLIGPDSKPVKTDWQLDGKSGPGANTEVKAREAARLQITAKLPAAGAYGSTISLIYDDARFPIALKITRTAAQPTISVVGLGPVVFNDWANERVMRFSITETGGSQLSLRPPSVVSLQRKLGNTSLQAGFTSIQFFKVKNDGTEELIDKDVDVSAHESVPIVMKLKDVDPPGEYNGSLALSSNDGAVPAQAFTFYIKRPGWLCALVIAFGVAISHWLRNYIKRGRPRLIIARRIVILRQDINALSDQLPDQQDKDLLDFFNRRLSRSEDDLEINEPSTIEPVLNDLNAKLSLIPLWSNLRRRIAAVEPPSDADAVRNDLDAAREFLEANKVDTEADINAMRAKIRAAFNTLDEAIRKRLAGEVESFQKIAGSAQADLSDIRKSEFESRVLNVLTAATAAIQKSPPDAKEVRTLINNARLAYAGLLTNDLNEKLTLVVKPVSMNGAEWTALKSTFEANVQTVREASEGTAAVKAYEDVFAAYLNLLIQVARATLKDVQPRVDAANDAEWKAKLLEAGRSLDIAETRLRDRELPKAQESYNAARTILDEAVKKFPAPQGMSVGAPKPTELSTVPAMQRISAFTVADFADPVERRHFEWLQLSNIKTKLRRRDLLVTLIVGLVAVALGVYSIWVDNPSWGTAKDYFVALLWGLGVHQLAGNMLFARLDLAQLEKELTGKEATNASPNATP